MRGTDSYSFSRKGNQAAQILICFASVQFQNFLKGVWVHLHVCSPVLLRGTLLKQKMLQEKQVLPFKSKPLLRREANIKLMKLLP